WMVSSWSMPAASRASGPKAGPGLGAPSAAAAPTMRMVARGPRESGVSGVVITCLSSVERGSGGGADCRRPVCSFDDGRAESFSSRSAQQARQLDAHQNREQHADDHDKAAVLALGGGQAGEFVADRRLLARRFGEC